MADVIVTNEVPATTTAWFALFRLYETLISAGWAHVESSRGTADTPSVSDRWAGAFGSLVGFAWIVLQANSGMQVLFRRGTGSSTTDGWAVWMKDGGYTAGGSSTDVLPNTTPADAAQVRGTHTAGTQTYSTDGSWFGAGTNTIATLNIGCRDASGAGDESFWLVAQVTAVSYTTGTATGVHRLALERVAHPSGLGISDANPYAWWCPESLTGNWVDSFNNIRGLLNEDSAAGTIGLWRRWWNAGQGGEAYKLYGSGAYYQGDASADFNGDQQPIDTGGNLPAANQAHMQATAATVLSRIRLSKSREVGFGDAHGGYTQNIYFTDATAVVSLNTMNTGAFAKFGNYLVVWWDGNAGNPPVEN